MEQPRLIRINGDFEVEHCSYCKNKALSDFIDYSNKKPNILIRIIIRRLKELWQKKKKK